MQEHEALKTRTKWSNGRDRTIVCVCLAGIVQRDSKELHCASHSEISQLTTAREKVIMTAQNQRATNG